MMSLTESNLSIEVPLSIFCFFPTPQIAEEDQIPPFPLGGVPPLLLRLPPRRFAPRDNGFRVFSIVECVDQPPFELVVIVSSFLFFFSLPFCSFV